LDAISRFRSRFDTISVVSLSFRDLVHPRFVISWLSFRAARAFFALTPRDDLVL